MRQGCGQGGALHEARQKRACSPARHHTPASTNHISHVTRLCSWSAETLRLEGQKLKDQAEARIARIGGCLDVDAAITYLQVCVWKEWGACACVCMWGRGGGWKGRSA